MLNAQIKDMAQVSSMKQIGCRNVVIAVEKMEWSNKMDLLAIGNSKGEVVVHRLNWQKITTFPAPAENIKVYSLSWQPDEAMLAVCYSNCRVSLYDIEKGKEVYNHKLEEQVKTGYWTKPIKAEDYRQIYPNRAELCHDFFLPPLPKLNAFSSSAKINEDHKSYAKGSPCFLVITTVSGKVLLYVMGVLLSGSIDLLHHVEHPDEFCVYDARLSGTCDSVYALVRDGLTLKLLYFKNHILERYTSPVLHLASQYGYILETKSYMNETIQCITEAWETVLLEMDNKLTKYANAQPEGSISADFLELLVFGYATHEIEEFLMDDLTEKGLKKLGISVDLSYSTIQNLVTKPLQSASINLFYFLNNLKGLSRNTFHYKHLLSTEATEEALRCCGALLMKVLELQQVIDQCVNDMKIFFCWMCIVIARLLQQDVPEETTQVTQEDTIYLAEYLNSFEDCIVENDDGTVTKRKFNLEKVGQYLENANLQQVTKNDVHHLWNKLLDENECLRNCTLLFPHDKKFSLIQQRDKLVTAIAGIFKKTNDSICDTFKLHNTVICRKLSVSEKIANDCVKTSYHVKENSHHDLIMITTSQKDAVLLEFDKKSTFIQSRCLQLSPGPFTCAPNVGLENLCFVDLQFYNEDVLSLLLQNPPSISDERIQCYFVQLPLHIMKTKHTHHHSQSIVELEDKLVGQSIHDLLDTNTFRTFDGSCTKVAVSGSRKIASILSDNAKKITILEMEVEDDDDDTVDASQTSILDISKESTTS